MIYVPGRGLQLEHRLIMEQVLGRPLEPDEHIHHIDGNVTNNDPANLQIVTNSEHGRLHHALVAYTREELVEAIHELARRTGRRPVFNALDQFPDLPSRTAFKTHFGSWGDALDSAGYPRYDHKSHALRKIA